MVPHLPFKTPLARPPRRLRCPAAHITKQWSAWADSLGDSNSNYVNERDFILRLNADSELSIFWQNLILLAWKVSLFFSLNVRP